MKTIIFIPNITIVNDIGNQVSIQDVNTITDGSCRELILYDCIDYIDHRQKINLLNLLLSKVRYGGELIIEGTDLVEVSRSLIIGQINLDDTRKLLYKANNLSTCEEMSSLLESRGFSIIHRRVNNYVYTIRAKRPEAAKPTPS
jgi:hypothetical protein